MMPKITETGTKLMPKILQSRAWGAPCDSTFPALGLEAEEWSLESGKWTSESRKWAPECRKWRLGCVIWWPTPQYPVKQREEIDRRLERGRP